MDRLISLQAAIDAARDWYEGLICGSFKGLEKQLRALPSAKPEVAKDTNVLSNDCISRQAAIDALYKMLHDCFWADDEELDAVITTLNELPSAQPEDCDTCKHGYFGDSHCDNCRVGYPSYYERRTDEQTKD